MTDLERFAERLSRLREEKGWTQEELAQRAGTKQTNVTRWERAINVPNVFDAQALATALGVELDDLLDPSTPGGELARPPGIG